MPILKRMLGRNPQLFEKRGIIFMSKSYLTFCLLIIGTLIFATSSALAGNFQALDFLVSSPSVINTTQQLTDANADYGIAVLNIDGVTTFQDLGGVEASSIGSSMFLAVNGDQATPGAARLIKIPQPNFSYVVGTAKDGLVSAATVTASGPAYVTNTMLSTVTGNNPNDQSDGYVLGMTVDKTTTDVYAAVAAGVNGPSILRIANGAAQAAAVIEFANPATPNPLFPNFTPDFTQVLMGPQSVAFYQQNSATDLFYFADGTGSDFCLGWAVQDLSFVRTAPSPGVVQNTAAVDNDFFTDEMRIHAPLLAGDYSFAPGTPSIHSDIVHIPVTGRMGLITGAGSGVFLVNDLNDNTEENGTDSDSPTLSQVLGSLNPTALTNAFTVPGRFNANTDIVLADYDGSDSRLVRVTFGIGGTVTSQQTLDLTTPSNLIPGRVSELSMDVDGNIYAVVGDDLGGGMGIVYVVSLNLTQTGPTPTPTPAPNFDCFETDTLAQGQSGTAGRFTLPTLVDYAKNVRAENDVITELDLIANGDLDLFLAAGASSQLRFFYINRPISITQLDRLTANRGNFLIFRSDGVLRSFIEVNGRLISPLQGAPIGTSFGQPIIAGGIRSVTDSLTDPVVQYYGQGADEENQIRYTSAVGFISWLKRQGVPNFAALNWSAPAGDAAAAEFEDFATRNLGSILTPQLMFNVVAATPEAVVNDIEDEVYGEGTGRWGGIYFNEPDVGSSSAEASSVSYSQVEYAEVGVYALDTELSSDNIRNENALRIVGSHFTHNLIGLSIDGMSPLIARNTISKSTPDSSFDARNFGGNTPISNPCGLAASRRFAIGSSGTGVYITARRGSFAVDVSPLFWGNTITRNVGNGVQVQQPGVGVSFGSPTINNQPRPLFGRTSPPIATAHEYSNFGFNSIFANGTGGITEETYQNFVYNIEETPPDFGDADPNQDGDLSAEMNYWGNSDEVSFEDDIRDGKDLANQGEVYTVPHLFIRPSEVEGSTELYD